jgi:hypothetical protein
MALEKHLFVAHAVKVTDPDPDAAKALLPPAVSVAWLRPGPDSPGALRFMPIYPTKPQKAGRNRVNQGTKATISSPTISTSR